MGKNEISKKDDILLTALAKSGDNEALSELLHRYSDLVLRKSASFNGISGLDSDDLYQEGMLGLLSAVYAYDEKKDASFKTFASVLVTRKMLSALRVANNKKNFPLREYVSLEEEKDLLSSMPTPEESLLRSEEMTRIISFVETRLSKTEKKVLKLSFLGLSYAEIADILDCTEKSVDNSIQRIRKKFREFK